MEAGAEVNGPVRFRARFLPGRVDPWQDQLPAAQQCTASCPRSLPGWKTNTCSETFSWLSDNLHCIHARSAFLWSACRFTSGSARCFSCCSTKTLFCRLKFLPTWKDQQLFLLSECWVFSSQTFYSPFLFLTIPVWTLTAVTQLIRLNVSGRRVLFPSGTWPGRLKFRWKFGDVWTLWCAQNSEFDAIFNEFFGTARALEVRHCVSMPTRLHLRPCKRRKASFTP